MWYDHALLIPRSYQVTTFPPFLLTIEEVSSDVDFCLTLSGSGGGGGAQRRGLPNSKLPIRNLVLYDAQTL